MEFQDWTSVEAHHKDQKALPENFEPLEPLESEQKSGHFTAAKKSQGVILLSVGTYTVEGPNLCV
jgi:hypothetical protein